MLGRPRSVVVIALTASIGLIGGCSTEPGLSVTRSNAAESSPTSSAPPDTTHTTTPDTTPPDTTPPDTVEPGEFPLDPDKPPQPYDDLLMATVEDLDAWWAEEMPRVFDQPYDQLEGGVFPAYPERESYPQPGCFDTYDEIEGNGFYCPAGDYIVWDDTGYARPNFDSHGSGAITGLMSHEWGHAIQNRVGVFDLEPALATPVIELQADCFSGAWFAHVARDESDLVTFTDADIRSGLIDTVLSADPVGYTPDQENAHGAGFDRVGAFQDGFLRGVEQCSTYVDEPPPITQFGFSDDELMQPDPGNLPYEEIIEAIPEDLNAFWTVTLPDSFVALTIEFAEPSSCADLDANAAASAIARHCPSHASVIVDEAAARDAVEQVGDFGLGYVLAAAWAEAAQTAVDSELRGETRILYSDCFVGVWAEALSPLESEPHGTITISPGDLDEAVATALLLADDTADENVHGDAFVKVDSFRTGVLGGIDGCNEALLD